MRTMTLAPARLLLTLLSVAVASIAAHAQPAGDADALYAKRDDLASARQAAAIWRERLQKDPRDFDAAWKLARAYYWLGRHAPQEERRALLEAGIQAGRTAARARSSSSCRRPKASPSAVPCTSTKLPAPVMTMFMSQPLAESFGLRQGLKYRGEIKDNLLRVLKIDPGFQQGSADRALGRWYYKVPGLFGGSKKKSEEHLRRSLTYDPNSAASLFFLAETLLAEDRDADARALLEQLLASPVNPDWVPEDREYKEQGRRLLATLR